jgi:hypothetical protein
MDIHHEASHQTTLYSSSAEYLGDIHIKKINSLEILKIIRDSKMVYHLFIFKYK